jgi:hypothetical protein
LVKKCPVVSIDLSMDDVINNRLGLILSDEEAKEFVKNESQEICWNAKVSVRPEFVTKPPEEGNFSGASFLKCMTTLLSFALLVSIARNNNNNSGSDL